MSTQETQNQISAKPSGLALLRIPFDKNQISKLPKPTKAQTDEVKADFSKGTRCQECGGWHHPKVVHLDYVGHAALTDRLLECDPQWNWEPLSLNSTGSPSIDSNGGMWIKLTVCGVTRLGYGHADGKQGGDAVKETIGDALRNAAMRFGAALDLWHKGDLHGDDDSPNTDTSKINPDKAIEGAKKENVMTTGEISGSFVMSCGSSKVKGKKLIDIATGDLESTVKYFRDLNKPLTGNVKECIEYAEAYLKKIKTKAEPDPKINESEEIPF